jgi:hypothetical protein
MTAQHDRPAHLAPEPAQEWEQAWALADDLRALADQRSSDALDDAGWQLRRRLGEQAAAETLGYRLADPTPTCSAWRDYRDSL